ncbi:DNA adenine methylase [Natronomonas sp. LN261]|uniref:DNA adenine methylase n=1 Tax=Natronomonas sp. LN261 TaxID=2750669 RepID=UPI0015EF17D0|nr:DNA adenine methylase [Natronomonas sp. LN261]
MSGGSMRGVRRPDGREEPPENHVSVFPWPGGKGRRSEWLLSRMPAHDCYVEAFGGSAALLYNKPRSHNEVYNDVNDDLVQFFEILRERDDELAEWVRDVPYSRSLHSEWIDDYLDGYRPEDSIERAGRFWCLRYMQFAAKPFEKAGFKVRNYRNPARTFDNAKGRLREIADRFRAVTIENRDCVDILEGYDATWDDPDEPDVLFYLDPPYVGTEHYYALEFDHEAFVEALMNIDGRWMCSYSELPGSLVACLIGAAREGDDHYVLSRERRHRMTRSNASETTERLICNFDPSREASFVDQSTTQQTLVQSDGGQNTRAENTGTDHTEGSR